VLLLFILLIGLGVLAYLQTPLGSMVKDILRISGTTTGTTTNDKTKPVITSISEPSVDKQTLGPTSASIIWATDVLSSSQVEYGTDTTYGTLQPTQPADDPTGGQSLGVVTHTVPLSGLQPNTTYHYKVKSKNKVGETVSDDQTFHTSSAE
jgi:hypothetical protein